MLNFVLIPFFYGIVGNTTCSFEGALNFNLQTNYIYCLSKSGRLLSIKLIYARKTERNRTKGTKISYKFDVTNSGNHCGNGTLRNVFKAKIPKMVRIAISKTTKPWENVYEVNIERKLYMMQPIHPRCIIILYHKFRDSNEMFEKAFQKASIAEDEDAFVFL